MVKKAENKDEEQCPHCLGFLEEYNPEKDKAVKCSLCLGKGVVPSGVANAYQADLEIIEDDREQLNEDL